MNKFRKVFSGLLLFCLAFALCSFRCEAAENYTYTVTFYPGNHGSFHGTERVYVDSESGSGAQIQKDGSLIRVTGLVLGDVVSFDAAASGAVSLEDNSKYYVKGIRQSGRDNNTVAASAFHVDGDADYVVAYGIQGNMVAYTVKYQDEAGNELKPSQKYYGNVGDKPVVAYLYIENYTPQTLAMTKTLKANEADNVFTFVYRRTTSAAQPGTTPGGTQPEGQTPGTGQQGTAQTGATTGGTDGQAAADGADDAAADDGADEADGAQGEEIADDDTPRELVDLDGDEEEVPKINKILSEAGSRIVYDWAIAIVAVVAIGAGVFYWRRYQKRRGLTK